MIIGYLLHTLSDTTVCSLGKFEDMCFYLCKSPMSTVPKPVNTNHQVSSIASDYPAEILSLNASLLIEEMTRNIFIKGRFFCSVVVVVMFIDGCLQSSGTNIKATLR